MFIDVEGSEFRNEVIDDDGFRFAIDGRDWNVFVRGFVRGYEERSIDPIPNFIAYLKWRGSSPDDMNKLVELLPSEYSKRLQRLMLLI